MIKISRELIESYVSRLELSDSVDVFTTVMKNIRDENPELHDTLIKTAAVNLEKILEYTGDLNDDEVNQIIVNLLWMAAHTYNIIKQQIIVNELNGG